MNTIFSCAVEAGQPAPAKSFSELAAQAHAAGLLAGEECKPRPMVVSYESGGVPRRDVIEDGVCGFAWITIRPGNCGFANYAKKAGLASKAYGGGVQVWVGQFDQSMTRKEAYASAYAKVLQFAGINAIAGSRMD